MSEAAPALKAATTTTTRLMITKMVLENFKSYAGVQDIGPFHKRFSSIVGPNGSGKSNVIDAMLFVFGKKAKQLRLNKVSELIHKSSNFPNLEYCTVAVHFQLIEDDESSDDAFSVVPGSEFIVTRTAYTNNTSKYSVAGKSATYTEVGTLLRSYGIDLDNNRFLILQGEVEQIAMMKPKGATPHEEGLLEYLEDIIGSNRFLEQIAEVSKVLDGLNDQRIEKVNRMKISERERDNLSEAKEEVEAYLNKDREVKAQNNVLYQAYIAISEENIEAFQKKAEEAKERLAHEKSKATESDERLAILEKQYEATKDEYDKVSEEVERTTQEFAAYERRDVKMHEDVKYNKAQSKKISTVVEKEQAKEEECSMDAVKAEERAVGIAKCIEELTVTKAEEETRLDEIMVSLQEGTAELRTQLEGKQAELFQVQGSVAGIQTEKEAVATTLALTQGRSQKAAKACSDVQARLSKLEAENKASLAKKTHAAATITECEGALTQLESELVTLGKKEEKLVSSLRSAVSTVEEAKASMQANSSGRSNETLNTIVKASKKGGPLAKAGVRGRLGDLGTIDSKYDVAISTACTMLDCIVVDTASGAQECMNFLRKCNGGRATFIPLDQMKEHAARMKREGSFPATRLFDLVSVSSAEFRPAFYQALGDTLVVDSQEQASSVAFEPGSRRAKYKVVTLAGNLIETSGAISGGGSNKKSGGMRAVAKSADDMTEDQVKVMEVDVSKLQEELNAVRKTIKETEAAIMEFSKLLKNTQKDMDKLSQATAGAEEEMSELSGRLEALTAECALTAEEKKEIKELEATLKAFDADMVRVAPNLKSLEATVESLQKQIIDVGGPKLKRAQAKVDGLNTELDTNTAQLSKAQAEVTNLKKAATKAATAHKKAVKDLEVVTSKLEELTREKSEMETEALVVIQAVESAKAFCATKETELKATEREFHELKEFVGKIRRVELDLQILLDESQLKVSENQKQMSHWKKQLEGLRNKYNDDQRDHMQYISQFSKKNKAPESNEDDMEVEQAVEGLPVYTAEELISRYGKEMPGALDELKKQIALLEAEREQMASSDVNMSALVAYLEKDADYRGRLEDLEGITAERNTVRKTFEELRRQRLEAFMSGFGIITLKLKEMYQMITLGGDAELELVDSLDPFSEGIVFSVRPPKKSWKNISNLSGGEKTLSSLALVFALHHFKPTPLYVMDEIDAALDFKNVSIVANYIKERTKNAQFVIISLRNNMFELADRLVGIYKTNDATKSVTINPKMFDAVVQGKAPAITAAPASQPTKAILGDATNSADHTAPAAAAQSKLRSTGVALW